MPENTSANTQAGSPALRSGRFGTFAGVFTPTLLTILGVILYVRTGWVVGQTGLGGAWLIIGASFAITAATGLALSSMVTSMRVGGGGAFDFITRALGVEIGGSVGLPLFLAHILGVVMYVFGFREGWCTIFPDHPAWAVDLCAFGAVAVVAAISARLAFRIQYVILAVIVASLVSAALGLTVHPPTGELSWWRTEGVSSEGFWQAFAVFFPAATGIMAGVNMSGELRDPAKSIPWGTLGAIAVSLVIYLLVATWLASTASPHDLIHNETLMAERSAWKPAVLAGLLGATFSSALATLVGAPRILQALAERRVIPRGAWLATVSDSGEPRRAMLVSVALVGLVLLLRDLNTVAPLITLVFLLTYAVINLVVLLEQTVKPMSYRPTFRVPTFIPVIGFTGCVAAMLLIDAGVAALAVALVLLGWLWTLRREVKGDYGQLRAALIAHVGTWVAHQREALPVIGRWAHDFTVLVPVDEPHHTLAGLPLVASVARGGTVTLLGRRSDGDDDIPTLADLKHRLRDEGVFARFAVTGHDDLVASTRLGLQVLQGTAFEPNLLVACLPLATDSPPTSRARALLDLADEGGLGTLLLGSEQVDDAALEPKNVTVWLHSGPLGWKLSPSLAEIIHLVPILNHLRRPAGAETHLIARLDPDASSGARGDDRGDEGDGATDLEEDARGFLEDLRALGRIDAELHVLASRDLTPPEELPAADLTFIVFGGTPSADVLSTLLPSVTGACAITRFLPPPSHGQRSDEEER